MHGLPFLDVGLGNHARLARHHADHAAGWQQHALRLRFAGSAEKDKESDDGKGDAEEQQGQEQMADGAGQDHCAVMPGTQMLKGLLAKQRLGSLRWS